MKLHLSLNKLRLPNLVYVRQSWWKIIALGILLAIGISLFPSAYCALADCSVKDEWCKDDCSQTCAPATGLGVLVGCARGAYGCIQDWMPDAWGVRCSNPDDCLVSECASNPPGYGCYLTSDGRWDVGDCSAFPACRRVSRNTSVTCCVAGSQPTPCPTSGPTITTPTLQPTPPAPLVLGQDPERGGVTITGVTAVAGEHDCRSGTITALSVSIRLSSESVAWIHGELARKYPGAHVKGVYPITPALITSGMNTAAATASFHFEPLDPGDYEVTVTATQDDGQTAAKAFTVHVALYEATLTH